MLTTIARDPTRTTTLRARFVAEMKRRFRKVRVEVRKLLLEDDAFGLKSTTPMQINVAPRAFAFGTDTAKIKAFRRWLQSQVDQNILSPVTTTGKLWMQPYIESAYKRGQTRAYRDVYGELLDSQETASQLQDQRLFRPTLQGAEETKRIEAIYTRAYNDLRGVTDTMSQKLSRHLALGLANGENPKTIARKMANDIDKLTRTRANVIARTEVIASHAEGQLDTYQRLGVEGVSAEVEWSTAGDNRVCPECAVLEADVMSLDDARGMIPLHPNCRCAWLPVLRTGKK